MSAARMAASYAVSSLVAFGCAGWLIGDCEGLRAVALVFCGAIGGGCLLRAVDWGMA